MGPRNEGLSILGTESVDPATADLDLMATAAQVDRILAGDAAVLRVVQAAAASISAVIDEVVPRMRAGGRLLYVGAGSAGRIAALDAAEVGPTFGVPGCLVSAVSAEGVGALVDATGGLEDDREAGQADIVASGVGVRDVVLAVSASGSTPYTVAAAEQARSVGALTVALVGNAGSLLADVADLTIVVATGPEAIAGSTRLRAGTAQKIVLNLLSTLVMVQLGHTYGNRMIGVRMDNDKLRARARRMLADTAGVDDATAAAALDSAGDAKTALVMLLTGRTVAQARDALARSGGRVREALANHNPCPPG